MKLINKFIIPSITLEYINTKNLFNIYNTVESLPSLKDITQSIVNITNLNYNIELLCQISTKEDLNTLKYFKDQFNEDIVTIVGVIDLETLVNIINYKDLVDNADYIIVYYEGDPIIPSEQLDSVLSLASRNANIYMHYILNEKLSTSLENVWIFFNTLNLKFSIIPKLSTICTLPSAEDYLNSILKAPFNRLSDIYKSIKKTLWQDKSYMLSTIVVEENYWKYEYLREIKITLETTQQHLLNSSVVMQNMYNTRYTEIEDALDDVFVGRDKNKLPYLNHLDISQYVELLEKF